jgi:hypothetical protein
MVKKARVFTHKACAGIEGTVGVCDRGRVARLSPALELEYERAGSLLVSEVQVALWESERNAVVKVDNNRVCSV